MARINVLDKRTAELIAAGEVIERPSSVIKELVENSIDAGAKHISVEIRHGGIRFMKITDDGCGIYEEDMKTAFLRHATSKVLTEEDLFNIGSLGFRGEALASICAVSRVTIQSRTKDSELGASISAEGGEIGETVPAGSPIGTTITVKDLFYNVPARMKFLKKDITEGNAVSALIDRLALSHPEVAFKFIKDGAIKLVTPGDGKLLSAIYAVYGAEFGEGLEPVCFKNEDYFVEGFICRPECSKATRNMEHFFINHRYIKSKTAVAAIEEAYKNSLMVGKFPACVININMPYSYVDVNVHPTKLEVKLTDEKAFFSAIYAACKDAIMNMDKEVSARDTAATQIKTKINSYNLTHAPYEGEQQRMTAAEYRKLTGGNKEGHFLKDRDVSERYLKLIKEINADIPREEVNKEHSVSEAKPRSNFDAAANRTEAVHINYEPPKKLTDAAAAPAPEFKNSFKADIPCIKTNADDKCENTAPADVDEEAVLAPKAIKTTNINTLTNLPENVLDEEDVSFRFIGEVFKTYVLIETKDMFIMIDKHAGHERLIFNRLRNQFRNGAIPRQMLIMPKRIPLDKELYSAAIDNKDQFDKLGFGVDDFGDGSIIVRDIPAALVDRDFEDIITQMAEKFSKGAELDNLDDVDDILHTVSCKAAIKGGWVTSREELISLVEELMRDKEARCCPHGRPIMIEFKQRDLDKMFSRIV